MMSVKELINNPIYNQNISVDGCIVIIDHKLWVIDSNEVDDYPNSSKIEIMNHSLKAILLKNVALYSGVTSLFHDCKIIGYISENKSINQICITVITLSIKDGYEWKNIDVDTIIKDECKQDNELDWFDI